MTVYLVGAGPGSPDLLTLRAAALLSTAQVVVVDRLVDPLVLELVSDGAEVIDAGKHPHGTGSVCDQGTINAVLIDRGRRYDRVVRLKGGDPFVFGRGGEEVIALEAAKVPVEVVPGVSSAFALPALAGVPVTHRGFSSSVTVASGHHVDREHWMSLGATDSTLVLLMAVERRGEIARLLIDGGRDSKMPVLVVERGATEFERRIVTELGQLANTPVLAPSVIVVGDVVTLGSID